MSGGEGPAKLRLALAYFALFFMMGVHLPYWPVWLADRGMDDDRIGWLLGAGMWARIAVPQIGAWADRRGNAARLACGLAIGVLACFVAFAEAHGFAGLFVLSLVAGLAFAPIMPLVDGLALAGAARGELDYGRVRLWGSASFIAATILGGMTLEGRDSMLVLFALQATAAVLVLAAAGLTAGLHATRSGPRERDASSGVLAVVRRPGMVTFLVAVACLQAGHSVLYAFGTKRWLAIDIGESTIGWLWATGVIAEVALFAIGERVVARIGAAGLLVVAGIGGIVRWSALAEVESVALLFPLQILHAASFAAMHLGAMSWIRRSMTGTELQRATGLYVAVAGGIALGLGMPLAGVLYEAWHAAAYHAMTLFAAVGTLFAVRLARDPL